MLRYPLELLFISRRQCVHFRIVKERLHSIPPRVALGAYAKILVLDELWTGPMRMFLLVLGVRVQRDQSNERHRYHEGNFLPKLVSTG